MNENERGYRGSKSNCTFNNKSIQIKKDSFVKEQRVDGSYCTNIQKTAIKVYSNGWRKLLSNQNPF